MEKARKYVERFFKATRHNIRYTMNLKEAMAFRKEAETGDCDHRIHVLCLLFDYGYAKGYRAALSEMKKGGA